MKIFLAVILGIPGVLLGIVIIFHYVTAWIFIIIDLPFLRQSKIPWWHLVLAVLVYPLLHTIHFFRHPIREIKRFIQCYKYKNLAEIMETIEFPPEDPNELKDRVLSLRLNSQEFKAFIGAMDEMDSHPNTGKILKILEEEEAKKN